MSELQCEDVFNTKDLEDIYKRMRHSEIKSVHISQSCDTSYIKKAAIDLYNSVDTKLNHPTFPLLRNYYSNQKLINRETNGKTVEHELFLLKKEYRKKGIAKRLHEREIKEYKKNGFNQVHLKAAADGIMTWPRSPFNFNIQHDSDERDIIFLWRDYVYEIIEFEGETEYLDIIKGREKVGSLPKEYVIPENKISFADWYHERRPTKLVFMYKNLDSFVEDGEVIENAK